MITNVLLILFLALMAYVWATFQGFFTALIQLIIVVAAGALALAMWEPLTLNFFFDPFGDYAWGLGLLGPFLFLIIALRAIFSQVITRSVSFLSVFDTVGGAACGLLSGILTAGITIVGVGFLPLPASFGGVQGLQIDDRGQVVTGESGLWLPVDRWTVGFFNRVSAGSLRSSHPLRTHQPDIARQANLFRLRPKLSNRLTVTPDDVYVPDTGTYYSRPLPARNLDPRIVTALGPHMTDPDTQLVAVNTRWHRQDHIADPDRKLRVFPSQIRLISWERRGATGYAQLHAPIAASHGSGSADVPDGKTFRFIPFNHGGASIVDASTEADITFLFLVPIDRTPAKILLRNLRLDLADAPEPLDDALLPSLIGALPTPPEETGPPSGETDGGADTGADTDASLDGAQARNQEDAQADPIIATTAELPRPVSARRLSRLEVTGDTITTGEQFVVHEKGPLESNDRWITRIITPSGKKLVRVKIAYSGAGSLLGRIRETAMLFSPLALAPDTGEPIVPIAYAWLRPDGSQQIKVDPLRSFRSAQELPVRDIGDGDTLYVYYPVSPGTRVVGVRLGNRVLLDVEHVVR